MASLAVAGATEAAPALRTGRFCTATGRSLGFWAFVGPKGPKGRRQLQVLIHIHALARVHGSSSIRSWTLTRWIPSPAHLAWARLQPPRPPCHPYPWVGRFPRENQCMPLACKRPAQPHTLDSLKIIFSVSTRRSHAKSHRAGAAAHRSCLLLAALSRPSRSSRVSRSTDTYVQLQRPSPQDPHLSQPRTRTHARPSSSCCCCAQRARMDSP